VSLTECFAAQHHDKVYNAYKGLIVTLFFLSYLLIGYSNSNVAVPLPSNDDVISQYHDNTAVTMIM